MTQSKRREIAPAIDVNEIVRVTLLPPAFGDPRTQLRIDATADAAAWPAIAAEGEKLVAAGLADALDEAGRAEPVVRLGRLREQLSQTSAERAIAARAIADADEACEAALASGRGAEEAEAAVTAARSLAATLDRRAATLDRLLSSAYADASGVVTAAWSAFASGRRRDIEARCVDKRAELARLMAGPVAELLAAQQALASLHSRAAASGGNPALALRYAAEAGVDVGADPGAAAPPQLPPPDEPADEALAVPHYFGSVCEATLGNSLCGGDLVFRGAELVCGECGEPAPAEVQRRAEEDAQRRDGVPWVETRVRTERVSQEVL